MRKAGTASGYRRLVSWLGASALLVALILIATVPAAATPSSCAAIGLETIQTDKADYAPEETVHMTGTGYAPACDVVVQVTRPNGSIVKGDGSFEPGSDTATTDGDGNLVYDYILNGIQGEYGVEVQGADGSVLATTSFSDSVSVVLEGGGDWSATGSTCATPNDAISDNNVRALCDFGETVVGRDFGLQAQVPSSATDISFVAIVRGRVSNADDNDIFDVSLSHDGGTNYTSPVVATDAVNNVIPAGADQNVEAPAAGTTAACAAGSNFGRTWTYSELSDANFRLRVAAHPKTVAGTDALLQQMDIDDIDLVVCYAGRFITAASVSGPQANNPGTRDVSLTVNHTLANGFSAATADDWGSTEYEIEGQGSICSTVPNPDETGSTTDTHSIPVEAPLAAGTYDVTMRAFRDGACSLGASDPWVITDGITVDSSLPTLHRSSESQTSATFSHAVSSGGDRLLLVAVMIDSIEDATSVTYGGVPLTHEFTQAAGGGTSDGQRVEIWRLTSPPVGTANVVVNFATAVAYKGVAAANYTGVDQSDPIGATGGSLSGSVTLTTTQNGSTIFGAVSAGGENSAPFTTTSPVTELWDAVTGGGSNQESTDAGLWGGQRAAPFAGSNTIGTTHTGLAGTDLAIAAVEIKALQTGTIVITKDTIPDGPQDFTYTDDIGNGCTIGPLDDDADNTNPASQTCNNVTPGPYTVTEDDPTPGFDLTDLDCTDPDSGTTTSTASRQASIDLDPGETVSCTFENTERGTIVITKDTIPDGPQDFTYTDDIGNGCTIGPLDDDADNTNPASQTCNNVTPGPYTVTEDDPTPGFDLTDLDCTDPDSGTTTSTASRQASIDLDPGETVSCTFENTERGTIVITKDTIPDGPQDFTYTDDIGNGCTIGPLDDDADNTNPASQTCNNVTPGPYTVTEDDPTPGFDLTDLDCTDPDSGTTTSTASRQASIDLDPGETVSCTFENTERGTIVITKDTIPDGPQDFTYTDDIGNGCTIGPLDDDADNTNPASQTCNNVTPGPYTVTEDDPTPGFDLTDLDCTDPDSGTTTSTASRQASIDLDPGETVSCTFENTERGTIVITKDTIPDGPQDFTYTDDIGNGCTIGPLDDDADNTNPASQTCNNVTPGPYTVTEDDPTPGFDLTDLDCTDPDSGTTTSTASRQASIDLDPGETVSCTFENTERGTIVITKDTIPDGPQDFTYTDDIGNGCTIGPLDDDADNTNPASQTCNNVTPGPYTVTEDDPTPGFDLTDLDCTDPDSGTTTSTASRQASIDLDPGETVSCTFENTERGTIVITKDTIPDGPQDFTYTDDIGNGCTIGPLDDDADNTNPASQTCNNVTPGPYTVTEDDPTPGFDLTDLDCTDPDSGTTTSTASRQASIDLDPGETVSCTFENTERGTIVIDKDAVPDDPQDFSFTGDSPIGSFTLDDDADGTNPSSRSFQIPPATYDVTEGALAGWLPPNINCADPDSGTTTDVPNRTASIDLDPGETVSCTFTNVKDTDEDGIPNVVDCTPTLADDHVVDPGNVVPGSFTGSRHNTLQAAVNAAADNQLISMYANTTENVVIGATTGSGNKDLRIEGCGHKVTAADPSKPAIQAESSAGADDGNTGKGERDIHIGDLDVRGSSSSSGYLIQTSKASSGTSTLLKAVRSESNSIGIKIAGHGNHVRGSNGVKLNSGDGIQVIGNSNLIEENRVDENGGDGIDVTGNSNTIKKSKLETNNAGDGIKVAGNSNSLPENDVFDSGSDGIDVTGNLNALTKNDVGDAGKGNGGDGIKITGDGNLLGTAVAENSIFANTGSGLVVNGNMNALVKNVAGDHNKGNGGDGFRVSGYGNTLTENKAWANGGDGVEVSGGTSAKPNRLLKNVAGDSNKGNGGNGFLLSGIGNGNSVPIELEQNTAKKNTLDGIRVNGTGWQLKNNISGGSASEDNGDCEFRVIAGNFNATGNKANNTTIAGASGSAFPTGCRGTP